MISRFTKFVLAVSLVLSASAQSADNFEGYTIGSISIVRGNVFDLSKPEENTVIGRGGNWLHIVTREKVIRLELLFNEGDPYSKQIIEESERNLRKFDFLTDVVITALPNHKTKTVDIVVSTSDQWSLIMGGTLGGTSENVETGIDLGEKNLLGRGVSLKYGLRRDNDGDSHSFGFKDSTFMDTRYTLDIDHKELPNEKNSRFILEKPFYALDTKHAHGISHMRRNYDSDDLVFDSQRTTGYYGISTPFWDRHILRGKIIVSIGEQNVPQPDNSVKIHRDNMAGVTVDFLFDPHDFDKVTYLETFRRTEDIPMGRSITVTLAPRFKSLGSTTSDIFAEAKITKNYLIGERDYLFTRTEYRRNDDALNEQYADFNVLYYMRWFRYQTLVAHFQVSYSQSETNRFHLGGTNGIRGYKTDEFRGRNKIVFNFEDRIFTYRSMLSGLIEPGFVIFTDIGNTWNDEPGDTLSELHGGFGVGLRIALLKAPGISLIGIDYAYSYDLKRSPVVIFGTEGFF